MSLSSIKGFGEGDPKPEKRSSEKEHRSGTFKKVGSVGGNPLAPVFRYKDHAKSKALKKRLGKNPSTGNYGSRRTTSSDYS